MATAKRPTTAGLRLPGAGTPALRYICQAWGLHNAADAIPFHLHPHHEHCANSWSPTFQSALQNIAKTTRRDELPEIQHSLQSTVTTRLRNRKASKVPFLNASDLKHVASLYIFKRASERRLQETHARQAAALALAAAGYWMKEEEETRDEEDDIPETFIKAEAP